MAHRPSEQDVTGEGFPGPAEAKPGTTPEAHAFEVFFEAEYSAIVALAGVLTGRRSVAEDIAQDAFTSCCQRWGSIEKPGAWIRRVVANLSASWVRRRMRDVALVARLGGARGEGPLLEDPSAETYWDAVRRLPRRQAQCVALRYLDDRSIAEIASILAIADATVRVHLHQARTTLAEHLHETQEDE